MKKYRSNSYTVDDVAKKAKVSTATVSRVFNNSDKVSQKTVDKVLKAAKKLDYSPNRVARRLRVNKNESLVIGIIIPDLQNPFFSEIARGVEDIAYENKNAVMVCNTDEDSGKERFYIETLVAEQVSGFIIAQTTGNEAYIQDISDRGIPIVGVDREMKNQQIDTVVTDNQAGAYSATNRLISLGHRRIGIINSLRGLSTTIERFNGYKKALKEHDIDIDSQLITYGNSYESGGIRQTKKLLGLKNPPTALFVTNNLMTLGCLQEMYNQKLRIPEHVALIGFDDMSWALALNPPLTAVEQPGYELGATAADLLLKRLSRPNRARSKTVLNPELIVRESCGSSLSSK
jgi:LacI family transcriptional regulator/LacI family repressor for deo operon, udp, cdd, tsx, nupC, and nupG